MPNPWAIDIETIMGATQSVKNLRHQAFHRMSEEIESDRNLPKGQRRYIDQRLTDLVKIGAAIEKKLAEGAQLDRATDSLNPLTAMPICVVCIDMSVAGGITRYPNQGYQGGGVEKFTDIGNFYDWAQQESCQFLGFNIDAFDIPCLRLHQARTASSIVPRIPAFWNASIDLRRVFGDIYNKGEVYSTPRNLCYYVATILDREAQQPGPVKEYLESSFTGADVAAAYVDNDMDKIIRHCTLDALMAALIAVKLGVYR